MTKVNKPSISILIVNYNGQHLLNECLTSIENLSYPKSKLEVIFLDNNSKDNSVDYVKRKFSWVKVFRSSENLGFAGGNNLAFEKSTGEYIVLLNTDTRVDNKWLQSLVDTAKPKNIGIVSSKLIYDTKFLELTIESNIISKSTLNNSIDFSPIGIVIEDIICENKNIRDLVWYESGFYEKEKSTISTRWCNDKGVVLLPFGSKKSEKYKLKVHGFPTKQDLDTPLTIKVANKIIFESILPANEAKQIIFTIDKKDYSSKFINLIQNAGNILLADGYSKDRGSIVREVRKDKVEFYERDSNHFNKKTNLLAACGAACLIKRKVIEQIGFFDGTYFMYYEDTDFSFRAWRKGWNILYDPNAIVYHKHKASTNDKSLEFFLYMIEKNHMAFLINHYPMSTVLKEFFKLIIKTTMSLSKFQILRFRDNIERTNILRIKAKSRTKALIYLLSNVRRLFSNRLFWKKREVRSYKEAEKYIY